MGKRVSSHRFLLRPQLVGHKPGQTVVPPRGKIWHPAPKREESLRYLDIHELPDGRVQIPRRHLSLDAKELVPDGKGFVVFRDFNAALRAMGSHIPKGVREETRRMHKLYNGLRQFHAVSLESWKTMSTRRRSQLIQQVRGSAVLLAKDPDLLRAETKVKAFERLDRAADLLAEGNSQAGITTLRAAADDSLQRFNELLAQRVYIPRREKSLREVKHSREERIFVGLDALLGQFDRLNRLSKMSKGDTARFFRTMGDWQRYFGSKRWEKIALFGSAARELSKATVAARSGDMTVARERLRAASRCIVEEVSKTADLYPDRIRLIRLSSDAEWKSRVMANQARLLFENLSYWAEKGFPRGFGQPSDFFSAWASFALSEGNKQAANAWMRARTGLALGNISAVERELEKLAQKSSAG
ncbi:MAG: hypothetical protein Q7R47_03395 [Candidatus Diapherotrites archaeon]|nr:hypothetical protein [Candidatus Diapherotrites archaeon]